MTSIFGTLNIGRVALSTQQTAIDVTGHNIANANTEGYTRQRVELVSLSTSGTLSASSGAGVTVGDVERVYDKFIQRQITSENQDLGYWEGMSGSLERVEVVFNETTGFGVNQAMDEFFAAWNDLANNPSGYVERISLLSASESLAMTFNQSYDSLTAIQNGLTEDIAVNVEDINFKARQIKDLNQQILQTEINGTKANDLRDQRDLLVNELAGLIDINAAEDQNGNINLYTAGGHTLVSGSQSWELSASNEAIYWNNEPVDIKSSITSGKLKGMLDARDTVIPDYIDRLNTLAENIINEVNTLHANGKDLNDQAGGNFFDPADANNPAKFMAVAISDSDLIAAADNGEAVPGGNGNALNLAELQNNSTTMGANATFSDYYRSLVSESGNAMQSAQNNYNNQTTMVAQLENYRESISGVSVDEEMVNLVKYQHAYEAAAQLLSTVDEMLDTLMRIA